MAWYHRLSNLARPERLSRDLEREMAFHLEERAEELVAGGMGKKEARLEAKRRFGNEGLQKERMHEADVLTGLESVAADLRYAARSLRAHPGFTLVAVLSLGLGIGANTAIFRLIDAVLLRTLPVPHPEELLQITTANYGSELTNPLFEQLRDRPDLFAHVFAASSEVESFDLSSGGEARRVSGSWVSGDFFAGLGVRPARGRLIQKSDDYRGCPGVAVIGYRFWQDEYGGDAAAMGKPISIDGHPFEVVGVAEPRFFGIDVGRATQVFVPLCAEALVNGKRSYLDRRATWFLAIFARPHKGWSSKQLDARLAAASPALFGATIPSEFDAEEQKAYARMTFSTAPAAKGLSRLRFGYKGALFILMAVVGLVLLIACANVANLLLTRATARRREFAIRLAIGAARRRLVRQLLTESLLLSLLGALAALPFAYWGGRILVGFLSTRTRSVWLDLSIDGRMLAFSLGLALVTGLLFGLAPAWRATRVAPYAAMKARGPGETEQPARLPLGKALVVAQIALSLVLVAAAGLLLGSFRKLASLDPGFRPEGVLLVGMDLRRTPLDDKQQGVLYREMLERLRALPGVRAASAAVLTPVSGSGWNGFVEADGFQPAQGTDSIVFFNEVSEGFFATFGTKLLAGRDFGPGDRPGSPKVAVINQTMAQKVFKTGSPIGKWFKSDGQGDGPIEVIGVVQDAKYRTLREEILPTAYLPLAQDEAPGPSLNFALSTAGSATGLIAGVKAEAEQLNRSASLVLTPLSEQLASSLNRERLLALLSSFFCALALLLASIGLYGTVSYGVARRRSEIAVRLALGAARAAVLRQVLGEIGRMVAVGVVLGGLLAFAVTRLLATFLFGLTPTDPTTYLVSALTLALVALASGAVPVWRALQVDPMATLRED